MNVSQGARQEPGVGADFCAFGSMRRPHPAPASRSHCNRVSAGLRVGGSTGCQAQALILPNAQKSGLDLTPCAAAVCMG